MAPISAAAAKLAYEKAHNNLKRACNSLERYMPASDQETDGQDHPPLEPRRRLESEAVSCSLCVSEIFNLEPDERADHQCTHQEEQGRISREDDLASATGSDLGPPRTKAPRARQPMIGVLREHMDKLDNCLDKYSDAITVFCSTLTNDADRTLYQDHLIVWNEHCEDLKDRAREVIAVLEAPQPAKAVQQQDLLPAFSGPGTSRQTEPSVVSEATPTSGDPGVPTHTETVAIQENTVSTDVAVAHHTTQPLQPAAATFQEQSRLPPLMTTAVSGSRMSHAPSSQPTRGFVIGADQVYSSTSLDMAIRHMNSVGNCIHDDLSVVEQEANAAGVILSESTISDLKELCGTIKNDIEVKYREAAEKAARMDLGRAYNTAAVMDDNIRQYQSRLRQVMADLRRARSLVTPSTTPRTDTLSTPPPPTVPTSGTGYKPFIERLKPPSFSGKIEDWPEFRAVWKDLMAACPESIQVQHLKANLPAVDAKRVTGINNMAEMWKRLERVYGDTDLNIITVKTNLENFVPKATIDYKRILEVFEAIETAATQLRNLNALQYLKEDFSLMSKLILKLPATDQKNYSQYITSDAVKTDPSSRWDKFWRWIENLHESAVQESLINLCDKPTVSKSGGNSSLKSGITCNTCGGVGHYARACSSKPKAGAGQAVKVNLAVAKITTKEDYKKYLPDTKKQLGNCPACKQAPHTYTRTFPFGKAEWPSNRLEACPQFIALSVKERGELVEKVNGCYKCTSFKHNGDGCFIRGSKNCSVVSGGTTCSGAHHKTLHGSGVAFCHKVAIKGTRTHSKIVKTGVTSDELDKPPDMSQPVLLEIQAIRVHGSVAKVMWDNGSSAALVTHAFAKKTNLQGVMVSYWLVVVGHQRVLRNTMLYTLFLEDNSGKQHQVQAYGIDDISEDSVILDLEGVKSIFPAQVYERPDGPIDILIGSMYRNIQPYGGEQEFSRGRLRLVKSLFGCGFILTGTHSSIVARENVLTEHARTLVNCARADSDEMSVVPVMSCNRAVASLRIPEFFEAEELGVAPPRSCKRCRGCKDCSYRSVMISREKELVVRRVEDLMEYDAESKRVSVSYPWTEDVTKLTDNLGQAIAFQSSVERKLLKDNTLKNAYNSELRKFLDRGAITKMSQEEIASYTGPVSYVSHHGVHKPDSTTTPLRIVTNTSLKNGNCGMSPNECMQEGPNALASLIEVLIGFRMHEVALHYDMTKAYQSIATGQTERHLRRIVWRWCDTSAPWEIMAYNVVTFGDQIAGLVLELVKNLAADMGESIDPEASRQIRCNTYVDDGAGGGTREMVNRFRGERVNGRYNGTIPQILGLVGLELKVMVASGDEDSEILELMGDKLLGHKWRPSDDKLVFSVVVNLSTSKRKGQKIDDDLTIEDIPRLMTLKLTKRMLLGFVMSQYDPMGLISPLLIILKIRLRDLYGPEVELGWDDAIPENLQKVWCDVLTMFLQLGEIILDRTVKPEGTIGAPELIGFADGSLEAYACAVYVRWLLKKDDPQKADQFFVRLVCGKARVTPVKGTTVPRSELSGYLILTRLLKVVVSSMQVKPYQITTAVGCQ